MIPDPTEIEPEAIDWYGRPEPLTPALRAQANAQWAEITAQYDAAWAAFRRHGNRARFQAECRGEAA